MAPVDAGEFTSGTEEEYTVGLECLEDENAPMRDVIVLFKGVNDRQLSDPGSELQRVLDFKKKLEKERRVLYANFDSISEFEAEILKQLQRWTRQWGNGKQPPKAALPVSGGSAVDVAAPGATEDGQSAQLDGASVLDQAKKAFAANQNTLAEELYARATTGLYNSEAMKEYARFLRKTGRYSASERTSEQQIRESQEAGDIEGEVEALANIGLIKRHHGQLKASETYFRRALEVADRWIAESAESDGSLVSRAYLLDNLALTLRRLPERLGDALKALSESSEIRKRVDDPAGRAHSLRNQGVIHTQLGNFSEAEHVLLEALTIFEEIDYYRGTSATEAALGEAYEAQKKYAEAEKMYEDSLAVNSTHGNRQGTSMNLSQLSRVLARQDRLEEAEAYASRCVEINEKTGNPEGLAAGLQALGRIARLRGQYPESIEYLSDALEGFNKLEQMTGVVSTSIELARSLEGEGDSKASAALLGSVVRRLDSIPNSALRREYEAAVAELNMPES